MASIDLNEQRGTLWVHNDAFAKEDILLNIAALPLLRISTGDALVVRPFYAAPAVRDFQDAVQDSESNPRAGDARPISRGSLQPLVFVVRDMDKEICTKHPTLQISVSEHIAQLFGYKNRTPVTLSQAVKDQYSASHVEIAFADVYLARADMWRMVVSELSGKSIYRGQQIRFLGAIKAVVENIYVAGDRVSAALFAASTRPIFRSASARFVIYIQMSREMWDFDTEGSGEIMFNKVTNEFLPALFSRWQKMNANHMVSIVFFTRIEYGVFSASRTTTTGAWGNQSILSNIAATPYQDYYRVVVSEMASGENATILMQLKKEFRAFLRDVSSVPKISYNDESNVRAESIAGSGSIISGRPSSSLRGNVLEAIGLASSQFSTDYVDRDLVRTGLSIVVITPGSGVFEVDGDILKSTTDNLVNNGVGIDLVCLSSIPLHSVPLFKYPLPPEPETPKQHDSPLVRLRRGDSEELDIGGVASVGSTLFSSMSPGWKRSWLGSDLSSEDRSPMRWGYAIPHWVDVSYWTMPANDALGYDSRADLRQGVAKNKRRPKSASFTPRCRVYELQMMGLMENEMSNIAIPYLKMADVKTRHQHVHNGELAGSVSQGPLDRTSQFVQGMADMSIAGENILKGDQVRDIRLVRTELEQMESYDQHTFLPLGKRFPVLGRSLPQAQAQTRSRAKDFVYRQEIRRNDSTAPRGEKRGHALLDEVAKQQISQSKSPAGTQTADASTLLTPSYKSLKSNATKSQLGGSLHMALQGRFGKSAAVTGSTVEPAKTLRHLFHDLESLETQLETNDRPVSKQIRASLSRTVSATSSQEFRMPQLTTTTATLPILIPKSPLNGPQRMRDDHETIPKTHLSRERGNTGERIDGYAPSIHKPLRSQAIATTNDNVSPSRFSARLSANISPWLTLLNPSNPKANHIDPANQLQRWQHVFPRPPRASSIKWKSLCAPAALPLTSEHFPTAEQLRTEWQESPYKVIMSEEDDLNEIPRSRTDLVRELISFRLSHGFQVVVGNSITSHSAQQGVRPQRLFEIDFMAEDGEIIFMSKGNAIHQLVCLPGSEVQVIRYQRKAAMYRLPTDTSLSSRYSPLIKTALSNVYERRDLSLSVPRDEYNWNTIDTFLSGHQERFTETLRYWRARFVLIPTQSTIASNRRPQYSPNEDNDEEIRIEGIGKLTQIFQRHRYLPLDEREFQTSTKRQKDSNPLAIEYYTQDISTIVNTGLNISPAVGKDVVQSGASTAAYRTANIDLDRLAQDMQTSKSLEISDRRWHWRMHRDCFVGSDLTTWLLNNFKDLESRDQAVDFGNVLMHRGLFKHVDNRHEFRDGNYFFEIVHQYRIRIERPESRSSGGWFGSRKSEKSTPSTPLMEPTKHVSTPERVDRARSNTADSSLDSGSRATPQKLPQAVNKIRLSGAMQYDVDHRKKSYRREVINLHFTEKHNVESCYHIRVEWMNVTAKFVEDAIVYWGTAIEKYGLRLVEVPIAEASSITNTHPFRSPYIVTLALSPPTPKAQFHLDGSFMTPGPPADPHFYTKALLKRIGFVLDMEAAGNFKTDIEVTFSWGKPDYRHTQYIHKSGTLLAQIIDETHILLLANRLCSHRAAASREAREHHMQAASLGQESLVRSPSLTRYMAAAHERFSPASSPLIQAAPEGAVWRHSQLGIDRPSVAPEQLTAEIEAFCNDKDALAAVYEDAFRSLASTSVRSTPVLGATIPKLGLPPSMEMDEAGE